VNYPKKIAFIFISAFFLFVDGSVFAKNFGSRPEMYFKEIPRFDMISDRVEIQFKAYFDPDNVYGDGGSYSLYCDRGSRLSVGLYFQNFDFLDRDGAYVFDGKNRDNSVNFGETMFFTEKYSSSIQIIIDDYVEAKAYLDHIVSEMWERGRLNHRFSPKNDKNKTLALSRLVFMATEREYPNGQRDAARKLDTFRLKCLTLLGA